MLERKKPMQIYFFTRSGRSKAIAEQLADRYNSKANRIDDGKNWNGILGFIKAILITLTGKTLPAKYKKPTDGESIALVFPVWADNLPPTVKTFVREVGREHIICIPTSMSSTLKDRARFAKIIDLVGKSIGAPDEL